MVNQLGHHTLTGLRTRPTTPCPRRRGRGWCASWSAAAVPRLPCCGRSLASWTAPSLAAHRLSLVGMRGDLGDRISQGCTDPRCGCRVSESLSGATSNRPPRPGTRGAVAKSVSSDSVRLGFLRAGRQRGEDLADVEFDSSCHVDLLVSVWCLDGFRGVPAESATSAAGLVGFRLARAGLQLVDDLLQCHASDFGHSLLLMMGGSENRVGRGRGRVIDRAWHGRDVRNHTNRLRSRPRQVLLLGVVCGTEAGEDFLDLKVDVFDADCVSHGIS